MFNQFYCYWVCSLLKVKKLSAWNVARIEKTAPTSNGPTILVMLLRIEVVVATPKKDTTPATQMCHSSVANAVMTEDPEAVSNAIAPKMLSLIRHLSVSNGTAMYCVRSPRIPKVTMNLDIFLTVQPNSFL